MKVKVCLLFSFLVLSSFYAIWKNSTMIEIDFSTVFEKISLVSLGVNPENVFLDNVSNTMQYDNDMNSTSELFATSDVVAIVKPVSRKQEVSVVNTLVEIKKSLKSDYKEGQQISLFEQFNLVYDDVDGEEHAYMYVADSYIPMDMNKEYLVFLKKSDGYISDQYGFLSLLYGKYPYLEKSPTILEILVDQYHSIDLSLEDLYKKDVVLFNISDEGPRVESETRENEKKNNVMKYNTYQKDYMNKLQGFIDSGYDAEEMK